MARARETEPVVDGTDRPLTAGHAIWVPVGTPHWFTVRANSVTVPLFFVARETATILREPTLVTVDRDLRTLMRANSVSSHTVIQPRANLARQILALVEDSPVLSTALPIPTSRPARIIAETLRFNPGDTRTIEELAASVHTTSRTIERSFRTETRMPLRQWRIRNRMEAAAVLLRATTSLEAVAHRVGYTNVNSFRRVFTGHFGPSPTAYVKRYAPLHLRSGTRPVSAEVPQTAAGWPMDAHGVAAALVRIGVPRRVAAVHEGKAGLGAVGVVLRQGAGRRHRQVGFFQAASGDHEAEVRDPIALSQVELDQICSTPRLAFPSVDRRGADVVKYTLTEPQVDLLREIAEALPVRYPSHLPGPRRPGPWSNGT